MSIILDNIFEYERLQSVQTSNNVGKYVDFLILKI